MDNDYYKRLPAGARLNRNDWIGAAIGVGFLVFFLLFMGSDTYHAYVDRCAAIDTTGVCDG